MSQGGITQTAAFFPPNKHLKLTRQPSSQQSLALKEKEKQIDSETIQGEIATHWSSVAHTYSALQYFFDKRLGSVYTHTSPVNWGPVEVMKYSKRYNTAHSLNSPKPQFHPRTRWLAQAAMKPTPGLPNTNTEQVGQDDNKLKSENKYDSIHLLCLQNLAQSECWIVISISFGPRRGGTFGKMLQAGTAQYLRSSDKHVHGHTRRHHPYTAF